MNLSKSMRRRWSTIEFLWLAMAIVMCQALPAHSQEPAKETIRPADTVSGKPSATQGGPTTRSPQTGATGANESARPADTVSGKPSATQGGPATRSPQTGATGANESARPADTVSGKPSATQGGPTTRSPQTGATGANESARPADSTSPKPSTKPPAKPSARANPDVVTLNFVNADIEGVVKAVSEITGKNFVIDPRVKGTVNIVSARPVPRALVYDVFLSALRLQGYAAVEDRGVVKILPEADAKLHPAPRRPRRQAAPAGDQIQTRVFTLKYESAAQLVPILRPLIAPNNTITAYPAQQHAGDHRLRQQPAAHGENHRIDRPAGRHRPGRDPARSTLRRSMSRRR